MCERDALERWLESTLLPRNTLTKLPVLLDLRSTSRVRKVRIRGSTHIPAAELSERGFELPARNSRLAVLYSKDDDTSVQGVQLLKQQGFQIVHELLATEQLWTVAESLSLTEGPVEHPSYGSALFLPSPFLESSCELIESALSRSWTSNSNGKDDLATKNETEYADVCDLGCGSGRDIVWLLMRPSVGCSDDHASVKRRFQWRATAIDQNRNLLDRVERLAKSIGVGDQLETVQARFLGDGFIREMLPQETGDVASIEDLSGLDLNPDETSVISRSSFQRKSEDAGELENGSLKTKRQQRLDRCQKKMEQNSIRPLPKSSPSALVDGRSTLPSMPLPSPRPQHVNNQTPEPPFTNLRFHLVLMIRFLERALFPRLHTMVAPGGFLLISTFVSNTPPYFSKPNDPRRILNPGELALEFGESKGWEVVFDQIEYIENGGRPVNSFLARRTR